MSPLQAGHRDPRGFLLRALVDGSEGDWELGDLEELATSDGWPVLWQEARRPGEQRLVAYYRFLDHAASVIVAGAGDGLERHREEIRATLLAAQPEWGPPAEPILARFFAGVTFGEDRRVETAPLGGWRRLLAGDHVELTPPEDPPVGHIRVVTRTSVASLESFVAAVLAPMGPRGELEVAAPVGLITVEGEYAAVVNARRASGPRPAQRTAGLVLGDGRCHTVVAVCHDPTAFDLFARATFMLTHNAGLGLGESRWRPYLHEAPRGWQPVGGPHVVSWIGPDCARHHARLWVHDARPRVSAGAAQHLRLFTQLPRELGELPPSPPRSVVTARGLEGSLVTYHQTLGATTRHVTDLTLNDGHFLYPLRMESDDDHLARNLERLSTVAESIRPLPRARARTTEADTFAAWTD